MNWAGPPLSSLVWIQEEAIGSRGEPCVESAFIDVTDPEQGVGVAPRNGARAFRRGQPENLVYDVPPGQAAECVFPSRHRVRLKVGIGTAEGFGMCGADPEVFGSVWVDRVKVTSRAWFSGHCKELQTGGSTLTYWIGLAAKPSVHQCDGPSRIATAGESTRGAGKLACADLSARMRTSEDATEYPEPGVPSAAVGEIEIRDGDRPVCRAVQAALRSDFDVFTQNANLAHPMPPVLETPSWRPASVALPPLWEGAEVANFDYFNDARLVRVFRKDRYSTYQYGTELVVQPAHGGDGRFEDVPIADRDALLLPCELVSRSDGKSGCASTPQGSTENDIVIDAGIHGRVAFRERYTNLAPIRFEGATYLVVDSQAESTRDDVAVMLPRPDRAHERVCLMHRVPENF